MNKKTAISTINALASRGEGFFLLVDFELANIQVWPISDLPDNIFFDFNGNTNCSFYSRLNRDITLSPEPFSIAEYKLAFDAVMREIQYGNTFLINLTCKIGLENKESLLDIYRVACSKYKILYKDQFVSFSPESFIQIREGEISSYPMKGTIEAALPNAAEKILQDKKEQAEHFTIVDLIRNDLSICAKDVQVPNFRYLEKIKSKNKDLLQVSSEVKGSLPPNYHERLGDIIFSQLPAGSISGAPKTKTVEIIQTAEGKSRGYYTGIAGLFDGSTFDSCVLIRYIEAEGEKLFYRTGGGITFQSELEKEYNELFSKIYIPYG